MMRNPSCAILKLCVLGDLDLAMELTPNTRVRTMDSVARTGTLDNGFGDVISNAKLNLWGEHDGLTTFALTLFLKFPTSQDILAESAIERGLVLSWLELSPQSEWIQGNINPFPGVSFRF